MNQIHIPRPPRSRRLPWLRCKGCGYKLAQMTIVDGHTAIHQDHHRAPIVFAVLMCPRCGKMRKFETHNVL